ncbi:D-alanyl-lipoteichoic acid biosynthesis protein DltD [Kurthia sibirica]|uniref:Protein DltD n=1 Tax=Kurthia sibirica TaxID=202750 RepID=A0A2U3AL68_9BACL|nr:D-alanyl-lipoteichoic acid biosynthesis protein DltD [Kurthia sibirica]PWI25252.1 D-alanyl-lipoteichoic acid biosynthesis protein DltD [Kurthia sibirica]GEK33754.1 protein DltD [Kurthia sibirica]
MKKITFIPLFIAVVLFLVFLFFPNKIIEKWISDDRVELAKTEMNPLVYQGAYMQSRMLKGDNMMPIFGSSELVRFDPFHPYNYTKAADTPYDTYLVGRGGTQSLTHFMNIAEQGKDLRGKKVVFIISPQWFVKEGLDEFHFSPNYSMLQSYDLAFNKTMDRSLRKRGMERLLQFDTVQRDHILRTMYEYELSDHKERKILGRAAKFVGSFTRQLQHKKDIYYSLFVGDFKGDLKAQPELVEDRTFAEQIKASEQYGSERVNNDYGISSHYYNKKIKPKLALLKDYKSEEEYTESPEYEDLQLVMDAFKDAGAKPLFVSIPLNGKWYDYAGFDKDRRDAYYEKMDMVLEKSGHAYVDYTNHEDDPYFLTDTLHIGWKGWVYLDQTMDDFYKHD